MKRDPESREELYLALFQWGDFEVVDIKDAATGGLADNAVEGGLVANAVAVL